METKYNKAKLWQIILFVFNNTASNLYLIPMNFVSYYANGVVGLGVALVSNVIMFSRIWDGVTDPVIGFIIDKTNGRFGKFRPFMLMGNLIMFGTIALMYYTTHLFTGFAAIIYWILLYLVYIIGYTFQNSSTRGGQTILTNDPKQRPLFARFDSLINSVLSVGLVTYITSYLVGKHGGFTASLFQEMILTLGTISLILTILAIIGISGKDRPEYFSIVGKDTSYKFKEIFQVIKSNRAIQMLVIAASTDKLAYQIRANSTVTIMIYGIIMGNYALYSKMSLITLIPTMLVVWVGTGIAKKYSSKQAMVALTWLNTILAAALGLLLILGDPTQISLDHIGFMTIGFIVLYALWSGGANTSSGVAIPMIADCADYEMYLSGRYAPGLMGAVFGFFDKLVSSLSASLVGYCVIAIGFKDQLPQITDAYTTAIFWMGLFLFLGMPILGYIASLVAMKFYPLDQQKMEEIQSKIANMKAQSAAN